MNVFCTIQILEIIMTKLYLCWASLVAQIVKNLPAMWETWVQSLDQEVPGWHNEGIEVFQGTEKTQLKGATLWHHSDSVHGWACFWLWTPESINVCIWESLDLPEVSAKGFSHPLTIALRINPCNSFGLGAFSIFNGPNCLVICFFATVKPFNILFSPWGWPTMSS